MIMIDESPELSDRLAVVSNELGVLLQMQVELHKYPEFAAFTRAGRSLKKARMLGTLTEFQIDMYCQAFVDLMEALEDAGVYNAIDVRITSFAHEKMVNDMIDRMT